MTTPLPPHDELATRMLTDEVCQDFCRSACKPETKGLVGLEFEFFLVAATPQGLERLRYDGDHGPLVIQILKSFQDQGWSPLAPSTDAFWGPEKEFKGLEKEGGYITVEPGGQIEFSSPPCPDLYTLATGFQAYLHTLISICEAQGVKALALGFDPVTPLDQVPWIPKDRYRMMRQRMAQIGGRGLEMMGKTCSTQVSVDYTSEVDMVEKVRLGLKLQLFVTALLANSPFRDASATPYQSYRSEVWTNVDPDRCGLLPFMFQPHAGFGAYIEFLKGVVPYGRDPRTPGQAYTRSFKALLESGDFPLTMDTWKAQTGMVFPDVRLNPYLEFRGADSLSPLHSLGLAAFWVGAFADPGTRRTLGEVTHAWSFNDLVTLKSRIPLEGMAAPIAGNSLWAWGEEILPAVAHGLKQRGKGEEVFLAPLAHVLTTHTTPADGLWKRAQTAPSLHAAFQAAFQDTLQGGELGFVTPSTLCFPNVPQPESRLQG